MTFLPRLAFLQHDTRGATSIEYALIASLITIGLIVSITSWGQTANGMFTSLETAGWSASEE